MDNNGREAWKEYPELWKTEAEFWAFLRGLFVEVFGRRVVDRGYLV